MPQYEISFSPEFTERQLFYLYSKLPWVRAENEDVAQLLHFYFQQLRERDST